MLAILSEPFGSNGWRETNRNNKHGFVVEERTSARGNPSIRVSCQYDYDPLTVLRAYCDPINRKLYDSNVEEVYFKRQFGVGLFELYQSTWRILMVAPRELSLIMFCNVEEDGGISITIYDNKFEEF